MKKIIKRILFGFLLLILLIIMALFINNVIARGIYTSYDTASEILDKEEINRVKEVYEYLDKQGEKILPGFNGKNIDLIIFNKTYEFIICAGNMDEKWHLLEYNEVLGKNIYRRIADNPQAFAVYTNGEWVGSMSTRKNFIKSLMTSLSDAGMFGYLIPPQIFAVDNEHYKGLIIHEMTHALEAIMVEDRLVKDQTISDVSNNYNNNSRYQELIRKEADYIEKAIKSDSTEEAAEYAKLFLETRTQRRDECRMTTTEIQIEIEFEWLEGLARYSEYLSSSESTSTIRKNITNIKNKMNEGGDERFYALGMAQALVLDKLNINWKQNVFNEGFSFETALEKTLTD